MIVDVSAATTSATVLEAPPLCLHDLCAAQAMVRPSAVAVQYGDECLTFAQLESRANRLAHALRKRGATAGQLVCVCVPRSVELVVCLLGVLKSGAAYVPLEPSYPPDRLRYMVTDAGARIILTHTSLAARLPRSGAEVLCIDAAADAIGSELDQPPEPTATPADLCYVMYTSGSTGRPKGSANEHRGLCSLVRDRGLVDFTPLDVVGQSSNVSFDPSALEIWGALANGARLVGLTQNPAVFSNELVAAVREHGVSVLFVPTAVLHLLARGIPDAFRTLRLLYFGGEAADPAALRRVLTAGPPKRLVNIYGPTECSVVSSYHDVTSVAAGATTISIGKPVAHGRLHIVDRALAPVEQGQVGELCLSGAHLGRGYFGRPALTAERFVPDPFATTPGARMFRVLDQARLRADGEVEYLGRTDDQVKIRGHRVELGEVLGTLRRHPNVRDAAVVSYDEGALGLSLCAYVVPSSSDPAFLDSLRRFLRNELPAPMVPSHVLTLPALPLTANGKVDKRALPKPTVRPVRAGAPAVPPRTDLEEYLVRSWERLLGVEPIGVTDNFFEIGGHSLLATRLAAELKASRDPDFHVSSIFRAQTVEKLAALLAAREKAVWPTLVPVQPRGPKPPIFAVCRPNVNAVGYLALSRQLGLDQPFYGLQSQHRDQAIEGPYLPHEYETIARSYIEAMSFIAPEGPYYLVGMCEGAHLAFEMTRLLHASGRRVALIVILDTWPWENTYRPLLHRVHVAGQRLSKVPREERMKTVLKMIPSAVRKVAALGAMAAAGGAEGTSRPARPRTPFEERMYPGPDFVAPKIDAPLTVFRVKRQPFWRVHDPHLGWGDRTTESITVHEIPGTHVGDSHFLREPYVAGVAERLRFCLRQAWATEVSLPSSSGSETARSAG